MSAQDKHPSAGSATPFKSVEDVVLFVLKDMRASGSWDTKTMDRVVENIEQVFRSPSLPSRDVAQSSQVPEGWKPVEHMFINKVIRDEPQTVPDPDPLDRLEEAFVDLTERFQKLPRPPIDRIDTLQYCVGAIRDVRASMVTRPNHGGPKP